MQTNQIICGDSNTILKTLPANQVDLIVTDPPYLVNYRDREGRSIANDDNDSILATYEEMYRILKPNSYCISFFGWTALDRFSKAWKEAGFSIKGRIVWVKSYASRKGHTAYKHEAAIVLTKGNPNRPQTPLPDVQEWVYSGNKAHPTEKAVDILTPLIDTFSKPGDVIVDPFAGSGSTLVAAALKGRRYLGIELDASYCQHAQSRLTGVERWTSQKAA